jgi:outer membrane protein TolC
MNPLKRSITWVLVSAASALGQSVDTAAQPIDLPAVLRLAGAENLEVKFAEEKLLEAQAKEAGALWQLFPTLSPGVGYRNHSGRTQAVTGQVFDVDKESLSAGATIQLQLEFGEAVYRRLAAKQTALAAGHGVEAQRHRTIQQAVQAYFDLLRAQLALQLHDESVRIARDYHAQVVQGVAAGLAPKADELRASAQLNRSEVRQRQAAEALSRESTRLAALLRLRIDGSLRPAAATAALLAFPEKELPVQDLLQQAWLKRAELAENEALVAAAAQEADGARYGPLFPTLGAQYFAGGLGGSPASARQDYASTTETSVTLSWRIGAGGLFDRSRQAATEARERQMRLRGASIREAITREVVDARTEVQSLLGQLELLRQQVGSTEAALQFALRRKEFSVGVVLEAIQAQQDALQAKFEYLQTLTEANKAQYRLRHAIGD